MPKLLCGSMVFFLWNSRSSSISSIYETEISSIYQFHILLPYLPYLPYLPIYYGFWYVFCWLVKFFDEVNVWWKKNRLNEGSTSEVSPKIASERDSNSEGEWKRDPFNGWLSDLQRLGIHQGHFNWDLWLTRKTQKVGWSCWWPPTGDCGIF